MTDLVPIRSALLSVSEKAGLVEFGRFLAGRGVEILSTGGTARALREAGVPVFVLHGERDYVVPLATGRDAARRAGGDLIVVKGAGHSWLLKDPETFPRITSELLRGRLGDAYEQALVDAGLEPGSATIEQIEEALYVPGAEARALTPELAYARADRRREPRYRWEITRFGPEPG